MGSMKVIDCPICSKSEHEVVSEGISRGGINLKYVICKYCLHVYMKNRPDPQAYNQFYRSGDYRKMTSHPKKLLSKKNKALITEKGYSHGIRLFENHLKNTISNKDLVFDL